MLIRGTSSSSLNLVVPAAKATGVAAPPPTPAKATGGDLSLPSLTPGKTTGNVPAKATGDAPAKATGDVMRPPLVPHATDEAPPPPPPMCCIDVCVAPAPRRARRRIQQGESESGSNYASYTKAQLTAEGRACIPPDAFTAITFDDARLTRSNLGGQGGRCRTQTSYDGTVMQWHALCDEHCDVDTPGGICTSPPEVYIANIGTAPGNVCIDLRITNESEYRAWRTGTNGVKRVTAGTNVGSFGTINLLGPRSPSQRPYDKFWHAHLTIVQLRYDFVDGGRKAGSGGSTFTCASSPTIGEPLTLGRTFVTFYDFDGGRSSAASNALPGREVMQIGPQATVTLVPSDTDIQQQNESTYIATLGTEARAIAQALPGDWRTPMFSATMYGVGSDNPVSPSELTPLQSRRSIMVMLEGVASFQVRYAVDGCCTTGRNFLVSGCKSLAIAIHKPKAHCVLVKTGVNRVRLDSLMCL